MGSRTSSGSSGGDRRDEQAPARFIGKGRYTNAPPLTPGSGAERSPDIEVQVGDMTLVLRQDGADRSKSDKYGSRSAPAYGAVREPTADAPALVASEDRDTGEIEAVAVMDLLVDDPIPHWGPWTSEVVSSAAGYHRTETRLARP